MSLLPEVSASMIGSSGWSVGIVGDALLTGTVETVTAGGTNSGSFAPVFLVGRDVTLRVADPSVEPDRVVVHALAFESDREHLDVFDQLEVGLLDFEVPEQ
jgi:hypothetical protein